MPNRIDLMYCYSLTRVCLSILAMISFYFISINCNALELQKHAESDKTILHYETVKMPQGWRLFDCVGNRPLLLIAVNQKTSVGKNAIQYLTRESSALKAKKISLGVVLTSRSNFTGADDFREFDLAVVDEKKQLYFSLSGAFEKYAVHSFVFDQFGRNIWSGSSLDHAIEIAFAVSESKITFEGNLDRKSLLNRLLSAFNQWSVDSEKIHLILDATEQFRSGLKNVCDTHKLTVMIMTWFMQRDENELPALLPVFANSLNENTLDFNNEINKKFKWRGKEEENNLFDNPTIGFMESAEISFNLHFLALAAELLSRSFEMIGEEENADIIRNFIPDDPRIIKYDILLKSETKKIQPFFEGRKFFDRNLFGR